MMALCSALLSDTIVAPKCHAVCDCSQLPPCRQELGTRAQGSRPSMLTATMGWLMMPTEDAPEGASARYTKGMAGTRAGRGRVTGGKRGGSLGSAQSLHRPRENMQNPECRIRGAEERNESFLNDRTTPDFSSEDRLPPLSLGNPPVVPKVGKPSTDPISLLCSRTPKDGPCSSALRHPRGGIPPSRDPAPLAPPLPPFSPAPFLPAWALCHVSSAGLCRRKKSTACQATGLWPHWSRQFHSEPSRVPVPGWPARVGREGLASGVGGMDRGGRR